MGIAEAAALRYDFPEDKRQRLVVRPDHRAYLEDLRTRGQVIAAGPFEDDSGALIIYAADDEDELERVLADDPYVKQNVFGRRSVHAWHPFIAGELGAS
jgi:uncharacterized protein